MTIEHINVVHFFEGNTSILFDTWTSSFGPLNGNFGTLHGVERFKMSSHIPEHDGEIWNYYAPCDIERKKTETYRWLKSSIEKEGRLSDFIDCPDYWVMSDADKSSITEECNNAKAEVSDIVEIYNGLVGLCCLLKACGDTEEHGEIVLAVHE